LAAERAEKIPVLHALNISEERELAGKVAGAMYLTAALCVAGMLVLPGVETGHWQVVVAVAGAAAVWALVCFTVVDWDRTGPLVSHFSTFMGFPATAIVVAATGGASSPGIFYLLFIVVYCSYFYRPKEAWPYLIACVGVHALPLAYDGGAVAEGLLAELIILGPTYLLLGGLILAGKRLLVDLREEARAASLQDSLTGLANRRALMENLYGRVGGERESDATGLLLIDLDDFKDANTLYGHPGGDQVLRETARALKAAARQGDMVARLGGDEFAIVAHGVGEQGMRALSERVLVAIREADAKLELPEFRLHASAGWALYPKDADTVEVLIAAADLAMRGAKVTGKDRSVSPLDWLPEGSVN
jgi:diguanylate cyclase (GGDEF)-like protein